MKRKRKSGCPSPILEDSPKRVKVHAQRKFAQGSNVNSPMITPIRELESESPKIDVLPEPVELLPIKRPNTEDFLTFLCFRGTPILPPNLNFFNTASIVDTNGQVHEIKSESSPKNGPIDIAKCGTSSEKPFIAFGVRKRADPIVISRQMDRKRRHALAIQALRRKYQEQKMAKIRAITISKLSEKVTNKTLVRTNTVSKTETVTKKSNSLQKTKVIATKHVKVTTQTLKTTLRPKIKPKMCLRSFRGRFVQKELPFRKKVARENVLIRKPMEKKVKSKNKLEKTEFSEDEEPIMKPAKQAKSQPVFKVNRKSRAEAGLKSSPRVTRSGIDKNVDIRRKQIKKRILMTNPNTIIKPRSLRLTTLKKTVQSQKKCKSVVAKQKLKATQKQQTNSLNKKEEKAIPVESIAEETNAKRTENARRNVRNVEKKDSKPSDKKSQNKNEDIAKTLAIKKDYKKITDYKKETNKFVDKDKKQTNKTIDIRKELTKSTDIKKDVNKTVEIKKSTRISNIVQKKEVNIDKVADKNIAKSPEFKNESVSDKLVNKSVETKKGSTISVDKEKRQSSKKESTTEIRGDLRVKEVTEALSKKVKGKFQEHAKTSTKSADGTLKKDVKATESKKVKKSPSEETPKKDVKATDSKKEKISPPEETPKTDVKSKDSKKLKASSSSEETMKKVKDLSHSHIDNDGETTENINKCIDLKKPKIRSIESDQEDKLKEAIPLTNEKIIASKSVDNKVNETLTHKKKSKTKSTLEDNDDNTLEEIKRKGGRTTPNPKKQSGKGSDTKKQVTDVKSFIATESGIEVKETDKSKLKIKSLSDQQNQIKSLDSGSENELNTDISKITVNKKKKSLLKAENQEDHFDIDDTKEALNKGKTTESTLNNLQDQVKINKKEEEMKKESSKTTRRVGNKLLTKNKIPVDVAHIEDKMEMKNISADDENLSKSPSEVHEDQVKDSTIDTDGKDKIIIKKMGEKSKALSTKHHDQASATDVAVFEHKIVSSNINDKSLEASISIDAEMKKESKKKAKKILVTDVNNEIKTVASKLENPSTDQADTKLVESKVAHNNDKIEADKNTTKLSNRSQKDEDSKSPTEHDKQINDSKAEQLNMIRDEYVVDNMNSHNIKEVKNTLINKVDSKDTSLLSELQDQVKDSNNESEDEVIPCETKSIIYTKKSKHQTSAVVTDIVKPTFNKQNLKSKLMELVHENNPEDATIESENEKKNEVQTAVNTKKITTKKSSNNKQHGEVRDSIKENITISPDIKNEVDDTLKEVEAIKLKNTVMNAAVDSEVEEKKVVVSKEIEEISPVVASMYKDKTPAADIDDELLKTKANADKSWSEYMKMSKIGKSKDIRLIESSVEMMIALEDSADIKSKDELDVHIKKSSKKSATTTGISKLKTNMSDGLKKSGVGKEDEIKKRTTKNMKKVKTKSIKEDVEDLISITNKMKKLETGSKEDVRNELAENDKFICKIAEKEQSKLPEKKVDGANETFEKICKTIKAREQECFTVKDHTTAFQKESPISKEPMDINTDTTGDLVLKKVPISSCKSKKDHFKKDNLISKKDTERRKVVDKDETITPKSMQRPTRKSKEAAAIYMEILSHKLVNDNTVDDDDNVSIDSFPELPNVKKTEKRENELKAQAKSSKDEYKDKPIVKETDKRTVSSSEEKDKCQSNKIKSVDKKIADEKEVKISSKHKDVKVNLETDLFPPEEIPDDIKLNELKSKLETASVSKQENIHKKPNLIGTKRKSPGNRTSVEDTKSLPGPDSEENTRGAKLRKSDSPKGAGNEEEITPRRQTRNASLTNKAEQSYDSDESFHIDIRVPRKKKITRSKRLVKPLAIDALVEKTGLKVSPVAKQKSSSSGSDHSTTSDINLQTLANKAKNKKFSKTKSMKKTDQEFSDSDEEPLSKLTNQSVVGSQKSGPQADKLKEDIANKTVHKAPGKTLSKLPEIEAVKSEIKPKRECAKIPQNYLPMLSSSDEDEIFHGFDKKNVKTAKSISTLIPTCSHVPPLLDLLHKDLGKRFGKEKVNMSNEQIEKWLKDSALAASSIKKENDEMLKFGERIPTESTLETSQSVDTEKLKLALLEVAKPEDKAESSNVESLDTATVKAVDAKIGESAKPQIDRKLIFRKCKKETAPNINAFSPENESSVYAFGEENEDLISTPFRRPSRRPSSTATSRSEDESSRHDDSFKAGQFRKPSLKQDLSKSGKDDTDPPTTEADESSHFYIPQNPSKHGLTKLQNKTLLKTSKSTEKLSDLDDFKYKIPSSPSASSSSSAKLSKKPAPKQKNRPAEYITPVYVSDFPKKTDPARLVEAPVFHPTDQEFQDPLEYIERIRHKAEQFGICRIVPPSSFKPDCKVTDDMRFTAYDQYVNKMLYRWGPNFKELMAIKKYLETQNISLIHPPWIGGMEIDLPRLYQTVQTLGGLKEVIEKKRWPRVSELMKIPKSAQDRVTKLDDIYCKYLLPYDTLSPAEREKLFDEVETEWAKRESRSLMKLQQKAPSIEAAADADSEDFEDNDVGECIVKGRNMALNAFYRIARNTMSMHFKNNEPPPQEVEQEYWKHVSVRQNHICVHSGSIDCGNWGYGFATTKNSPFARHPWNLKVLTNNNCSVLRSLGPIMGVTVPTLHVGMVFSACCWYRDPHGLPWIEYLHTGGNKIWYGIPNSASDAFQSTLRQLVPNYCKNKELWLPSDTIMVPPSLLIENNVSLCRTIQEPGQFIVVFPKAFTSSISTGYVVSESVYFAPTYWLKTARSLFDALRNSSEPSMFSLDRLLLSITTDGRCSADILRQVIPHVQELCDREKQRRDQLKSLGELARERLPIPDVNRGKKRKFQQGEEGDYECETCKMSLFVSMVFDTQEGLTYCLDHGIEMIETKKIPTVNCKFMFTYDDDELANVPDKMRTSIETKLQKKVPNKYAGMPTLLHRQGETLENHLHQSLKVLVRSKRQRRETATGDRDKQQRPYWYNGLPSLSLAANEYL